MEVKRLLEDLLNNFEKERKKDPTTSNPYIVQLRSALFKAFSPIADEYELRLEVIGGSGNANKTAPIYFLAEGHEPSQGIYPVIALLDEQKKIRLILGYSDQNPPPQRLTSLVSARACEMLPMFDERSEKDAPAKDFTASDLSNENVVSDLRHLLKAYKAVLKELSEEVTTFLESAEGSPWKMDELRASIKTYVEMLQKQARDEKFNKVDYYRKLAQEFGRSEKAFEYRMQNVSYVRSILGKSWVRGLKPAKNVGENTIEKIQRLFEEIERQRFLIEAAEEAKARDSGPPKGKPRGKNSPTKTERTVTAYERDSRVVSWALHEAKGRCELCALEAPFKRPSGDAYLEVHHVVPLAENGPDTTSNAVALCPNCHREVHHGADREKKIQTLYSSIKRLKRPVLKAEG